MSPPQKSQHNGNSTPPSPSQSSGIVTKFRQERRSTTPLNIVTILFAFSAGFNSAFVLVFHHGGFDVPAGSVNLGSRGGVGNRSRRPSRGDGRNADWMPGPGVPGRRLISKAGENRLAGPGADATDDADAEVGVIKNVQLSCERYGGPPVEIASEMVYWSDVPSDKEFVSPFKKEGEVKYLTFEHDLGGWNNMRMAMETMVALAHAMGRTLVLLPKKKIYLHTQNLGFADFYHLDTLGKEHQGIDVVSMQEFLEREAMTGRLKNKSGEILFPPQNRTNWDGDGGSFCEYLRTIAYTPEWKYDECMAVFPASEGNTDIMKMQFEVAMRKGPPSMAELAKKPLPVDAPPVERLREFNAGRNLCIYDEEMQKAPVVHFMVDSPKGLRYLVHFYAFLFFEDWRHDLHLKRLIRDHLRYSDELQCAAARVVAALRDRARKRDPVSNPEGLFDTLHIRRGDFQLFPSFKSAVVNASVLYESSKEKLTENATVYISTDEKDRSFFKPFIQHYDVCFMDDFKSLFPDLNTNYYGMLDQLIASRGRVFFGTWYSTFSAYINRLRGYGSVKHKLKGHENGEIQSYYFLPEDKKMIMRYYAPVHKSFWIREFPTAWRDIDKGTKNG